MHAQAGESTCWRVHAVCSCMTRGMWVPFHTAQPPCSCPPAENGALAPLQRVPRAYPAKAGVQHAVLEKSDVSGAVARDALHLEHIAVCEGKGMAGRLDY